MVEEHANRQPHAGLGALDRLPAAYPASWKAQVVAAVNIAASFDLPALRRNRVGILLRCLDAERPLLPHNVDNVWNGRHDRCNRLRVDNVWNGHGRDDRCNRHRRHVHDKRCALREPIGDRHHHGLAVGSGNLCGEENWQRCRPCELRDGTRNGTVALRIDTGGRTDGIAALVAVGHHNLQGRHVYSVADGSSKSAGPQNNYSSIAPVGWGPTTPKVD